MISRAQPVPRDQKETERRRQQATTFDRGGKYMFDHWSGDSTATTSSASVLMDGPKVVTAEWRTDNTMPYIIIAAIGAVLIATVALLVLKRRRKAPSSTTASQPPIGLILHVEPAPYPTSQERLETQRHWVASRWCISCGREILEESIYCEHCGTEQPGLE
jgi:LPXTG-motif cell wall-anchored protein